MITLRDIKEKIANVKASINFNHLSSDKTIEKIMTLIDNKNIEDDTYISIENTAYHSRSVDSVQISKPIENAGTLSPEEPTVNFLATSSSLEIGGKNRFEQSQQSSLKIKICFESIQHKDYASTVYDECQYRIYLKIDEELVELSELVSINNDLLQRVRNVVDSSATELEYKIKEKQAYDKIKKLKNGKKLSEIF